MTERDEKLDDLGVAQSNYEKVCSTNFELTVYAEVRTWYEGYAKNVVKVKSDVNGGWDKVKSKYPFYTSALTPLPSEVKTFYNYFKTYC